jgi:pimeloyl-ACP methyl ester carboxylesterase
VGTLWQAELNRAAPSPSRDPGDRARQLGVPRSQSRFVRDQQPLATDLGQRLEDGRRPLQPGDSPFPGAPAFPFDTANGGAQAAPNADNQKLAAALAALDPPRAHYQQYLCTRQANEDLWHPPEGLHGFLRTFFHVKSGDWPGNQPHPLKAPTAAELAKMPTYYIMELGKTMPRIVAPFQPSSAEVQACRWLTEPELCTWSAPGALDAMQARAMTRLADIELIDGAGHWIQQEQPDRLAALLLAFARDVGPADLAGGQARESVIPAVCCARTLLRSRCSRTSAAGRSASFVQPAASHPGLRDPDCQAGPPGTKSPLHDGRSAPPPNASRACAR